ncbi:MAG TPA: sulfur carrier protein ThiS [Desulfobacteria bacterium]|nr:sulfur carrier protein ThiS [Desulfobacteria bacterium]
MKVKVNGKEIDLEKGTTILSLLESRGLNPSMVVIEYNHDIPKRETWGDICINEGDNVEIIRFLGGG